MERVMVGGRAPGLESAGRPLWQKLVLAVLCLVAGAACLEGRAFPSIGERALYGALVAGVLLAVTYAVRRRETGDSWQVPFAFFVFGVVQLLNNTVPQLFLANVLHERPVDGDPLASTVGGTVAVQVLDTVIAVLPILLLVKVAGLDLGSVYARVGRLGRAYVIAIAGFVLFFVVTGVVPLHRLFPTHGDVSMSRYLALMPALVVLVVSNGFQEEFLFRGLFLERYNALFGAVGANVVQALVFAVAHAGVSYTPITLIFLAVFVFPLGLLCGYLMRSSDGVVAPALFHAGADLPIYLAFLTFVS
jgi:membrane protease YdiL (CAAX protease family)